jgi:hypothetical protein
MNQPNTPNRVSTNLRCWAVPAILLTLLWLPSGCFTMPDATGEILELSVTPTRVCIDRDQNIRITFKARSSNQQCVLIYLNDHEILNRGLDGPVDGEVKRCGTAEWGETYTLSLKRVFGDNIPPDIKVRIELPLPAETAHYVPGGKLLDKRETSIVTALCN